MAPETWICHSGPRSTTKHLRSQAMLRAIVAYKKDLGCDACGIEPYCGGRCPVQANTGGIERARQYCAVMRKHVQIVKGYAAPLVDLLQEHGITLAHLYRSARYAKYTDVTP